MLHETAGQDLAEYGIALAVIAAAASVAAVAVAQSTTTLWARALQSLIVAALAS